MLFGREKILARSPFVRYTDFVHGRVIERSLAGGRLTSKRRRFSMEKCFNCGADTVLYVDNRPICLACDQPEGNVPDQQRPGMFTLEPEVNERRVPRL